MKVQFKALYSKRVSYDTCLKDLEKMLNNFCEGAYINFSSFMIIDIKYSFCISENENRCIATCLLTYKYEP